jgi:hypothetical protein
MSDKLTAKPITQCYLYNKMTGYTKVMTNAILNAERLDTNTIEFAEDIGLEIKRSKAPVYLLKILTSKNTHLIHPEEPLPKPLRVFVAKDIKTNAKLNAFIDYSGIISTVNNGRYRVDTNVLIAYLISAKHSMMYYGIPGVFTKKSNLVILETRAFAKLFTHVIDYIANISIIPDNREKMMYLASKYFLYNQLQITDDDKVNEIAMKVADITESQQNIFNILTRSKDLTTLQGFVDTIKEVFKINKLTLSLVIEKWMFLYGSTPVLALEFLPSFLTMITDAYSGVYLNNQKSIEKILSKDLVELGKMLIYDITI